ncbi:MurR/RpiR family transcriptional regulator [[Pasteurella] aerogenes]|nr:putative HTH-type transcriptional regulator [[Pasteurella] aerogenes]
MQENSQLVRLQNEIRTRYDSLSKRLKQVAQYVLDNHNSVVFDTVATISERAGVPPSTLIRFANAFGFSGFNEMKQIFRENLMEETASYTERLQLFRQLEPSQDQQESAVDILNIFAQANHQALQQLANQTSAEQLQTAVEILNQANNIFIVGLKRSFSIACYLDYALHHLDCRSFVINGLGGMFDEQLSQVKSGDVVVAISFSPYAKETLEIMNTTSQRGIRQIAITDSQISPLIAFSDVSFVIKEAQVRGFRSQCATMTLVQTLAIALAMAKEQGKGSNSH